MNRSRISAPVERSEPSLSRGCAFGPWKSLQFGVQTCENKHEGRGSFPPNHLLGPGVRLLVTLQFICPARRVGIGQCCVWSGRTPSGIRDHSSNVFPLRGLMHIDADRMGQVSSLCPRRRCSDVIKKNGRSWLVSRHN